MHARLLKIYLPVMLALACLVHGHQAEAAGYFLRLGPSSLGNGGPNPPGLPPQMTDIELSLITNNMLEFNVGLPGMLVGYRMQRPWGGYVSAGGGILIEANGAGPGAYTAFGYDCGWRVLKFNFEYKQGIGIGSGAVLSPYAVRFGMGLWFK